MNIFVFALAMTPYMYNDDNEWVSFENDVSLSKKVCKKMEFFDLEPEMF